MGENNNDWTKELLMTLGKINGEVGLIKDGMKEQSEDLKTQQKMIASLVSNDIKLTNTIAKINDIKTNIDKNEDKNDAEVKELKKKYDNDIKKLNDRVLKNEHIAKIGVFIFTFSYAVFMFYIKSLIG